MATAMSDNAKAYYADGYRRLIGGVPCKVFSKKLPCGRYIRNPKWVPTI
jgi:hypothetical protein